MVWQIDNNSAYSSKVLFPGTNGEKRILIADLSLHKSISQELRAILPGTVVAVQPLLNGTRRLYTMFPDFKQYPYVLPGYRYNSLADLQATLEEKVIKPAEEKAKELEKRYLEMGLANDAAAFVMLPRSILAPSLSMQWRGSRG